MATRIGRPLEDIVGHDLFTFLPGRIAESRMAHIGEVLRTGKPVEFTDQRNGRSYANHIFPGFDASGKVWSVAAVAFDVTELRTAEEDLRERENLLRLGLDAARRRADGKCHRGCRSTVVDRTAGGGQGDALG